jgi:hypothetical protein
MFFLPEDIIFIVKTIQVFEQSAKFLNITAGVTDGYQWCLNKRNYFQCFTES